MIAPFLGGPDAALWLKRAKTMSGPVLRKLAEQEKRLGRPTGPNQRLKVELDAEQWKVLATGSLPSGLAIAAEKVRKVGGGELPVAEIIEVLAVNFLQTPFDESELLPDEEESSSELHTATDEGEPEAETGAEAEEADEIERGRSLRRQKLEEADYQCEMECDRRTDLQVDHIEPQSRNPARKWDPDNLCVACVACHRIKTAGFIRVHGRNEDGTLEIERPVRWLVFAGPGCVATAVGESSHGSPPSRPGPLPFAGPQAPDLTTLARRSARGSASPSVSVSMTDRRERTA